MKSVIFALAHFKKYVNDCGKVVIFSDVSDIEKISLQELSFKKNPTLKKLQSELHLSYQKAKSKHLNRKVSIHYLSKEQ